MSSFFLCLGDSDWLFSSRYQIRLFIFYYYTLNSFSPSFLHNQNISAAEFKTRPIFKIRFNSIRNEVLFCVVFKDGEWPTVKKVR